MKRMSFVEINIILEIVMVHTNYSRASYVNDIWYLAYQLSVLDKDEDGSDVFIYLSNRLLHV